MRITCFLLLLLGNGASAQTRMIVVGNVYDAKSREPLAFATISLANHIDQTITNAKGHFELSVPAEYESDTLRVTFIGYQPALRPIANRKSVEDFYLEESATLLDEITVVHRKLNLRDIDHSVKKIRGNLYVMDKEVTNGEYNSFLGNLEEYNKKELHRKCDFDLSGYADSEKEFFRRYSSPFREGNDSVAGYREYPAVNVPYEGAVEFCAWLTDQYNSNTKKKKFKKVKFRLPTIKEWQIAALGYADFQTWDVGENMIELVFSPDTMDILPKRGQKRTVKVNDEVLYPWFIANYYRKKPYNNFNCYLGNFKITQVAKVCATNPPGYDYYIMMGKTGGYFPNQMGVYDMSGNVAEMIDTKGKACGGSWDDLPEDATIYSVKNYSRPSGSVGFRVFMEVLEE